MKTLKLCWISLSLSTFSGVLWAAQPQTCADVGWLPGLPSSHQAINNPAADKASSVCAQCLASEEAKKKAYLSCNTSSLFGKPVLGEQIKAGKWGFIHSTASQPQLKATSPTQVAQAIYLRKLHQSGAKFSGYSSTAAQWRIHQAQLWCEANDKIGDGDIKLPSKLPLLDEGVAKLDSLAIKLAWQTVSAWTSDQLHGGCGKALKEFSL